MADAEQSQKPRSKFDKYATFLSIGFITTTIASGFEIHNPSNYTPIALLTKLLSAPIAYFVILGIISLAVGACRRNIKKYWFPTLAWLFLCVGIFDIVVKGCTEFVFRPQVDQATEELVR